MKGKMDGEGVLRGLTGDIYTGKFKNGFKHGKGKIVYGNGSGWYSGSWTYNKMEGEGISTDGNGNRYEGAFRGNSRHGEGQCTYATDGSRYIGVW